MLRPVYTGDFCAIFVAPFDAIFVARKLHLQNRMCKRALSMALPFYKYLPTKENRLRWNATKIINDTVMKVCFIVLSIQDSLYKKTELYLNACTPFAIH